MKQRGDYLYAVQTKDKFKAVCYDNYVYEWCMQTG